MYLYVCALLVMPMLSDSVCDRISASEQSSVKNLTKRNMAEVVTVQAAEMGDRFSFHWVTGFHFTG